MEYYFDRIIERKGTGAINSNLSNSLDTVQLTPPQSLTLISYCINILFFCNF